jgi:ketosteroid isomerase-like protein
MLFVVGVAYAAADEAGDRRQIQTVREQWHKAFLNGDTEKMSRFETDEFIVITENIVSNKKDQLAGIKKRVDEGNWLPKGITSINVDVKIRFVGKDAAIVSGHVANKVPDEEKPRMQFAITEVWQRTDTGWRAAHLHFHRIQESGEN